MSRMVECVKLGREAEGLDFPPYPGELAQSDPDGWSYPPAPAPAP